MNPHFIFAPKLWGCAGLLLASVFLIQPTASSAAPSTPPATQSATSGWLITATLIPKGWKASTKGFLGWSIAIDGDTLVAGAPFQNNTVGTAEVFVRSAGAWSWQAELAPNDGKPGDEFGWSVAIRSDAILVGAPLKDKATGRVYLFQRTDANWTQKVFPQPANGQPGDLFGWGIAFTPAAPTAQTAQTATPAATSAASAINAKLSLRAASITIPHLLAPVDQPISNQSPIFFTEPGTAKDAGGVLLFDPQTNNFVTVHGDTPNAFLGGGQQPIWIQDKLNELVFGGGLTLFGGKVQDELTCIPIPADGSLTVSPSFSLIPIDKQTVEIGSTFILPQPDLGVSGLFLFQSVEDKTGKPTSLNEYTVDCLERRIVPKSNLPTEFAGDTFGYGGASFRDTAALIGKDAKGAGSIGFFSLQGGNLTFSGDVPFPSQTWQFVANGGTSSLGFSTDGTMLGAAAQDPKTHGEAIILFNFKPETLGFEK